MWGGELSTEDNEQGGTQLARMSHAKCKTPRILLRYIEKHPFYIIYHMLLPPKE